MRPFIPASAALLIVLCAGAMSTACAPAAAGTAPDPSTSVTPPPMPLPAANDDREGATYFATHWVDLIGYAHRTLDANPLRSLGLPSCDTCQQFVAQLDHDKAAGVRYDGGGVHFLSSDPTDFQPAKSAVVNVQFEQGEMRVLDHTGTATDTVPAGTVIFNFNLQWTPDGWRAAKIKIAQPAAQPTTPSTPG